MRSRTVTLIAAALGILVAQNPASGQTYVELRGGFTAGSHSATASGFDFAPGPAFQALVIHQIKPRISLFGGYARTTFGCEEGFCLDRDLTVSGSHAVVGAEGSTGWAWLRLGVLVGSIEVGTEGESPDTGPGFQVGAGVSGNWGRLSLRPGLSYRWMSANTPSSSDHAVALGADLGIAVRLGSLR
jgi:hypothetical protein